jgi:L-alanine-DL-glutamate epimerase-like enolase superfamily enzyme
MALALPAGAWLDRYTALAAPLRNKVKITALKAMALRDLAGKILNAPVCNLLGGPFRDAISMYSHGDGFDTQSLDIAHPDLAFAGGFTGTKKIADYAAITRTPVALHNVGSLVLCFANAHFGASIQNFYRSESSLGRPTRHVEQSAGGTEGAAQDPRRPRPRTGSQLGLHPQKPGPLRGVVGVAPCR